MPKRSNNGPHYEDLCKKLKKIENEIRESKTHRRRVRVLSSSSSSSSSQVSPVRQSESDDSTPPSPCAGCHLQQDAAPLLPPLPCQVDGNTPEPTLTPTANEVAANHVFEEVPAELDAEILDILGVDPTKTNVFGKPVQNDVAVRFEHIATAGLSKEARKDLTDKYLIPENCKLIGAPALNPEIKAALSEAVIKRDKLIEYKQTIMAAAISSLGEAITRLLSSKEKNTDLLRLLMDTGRTLSDCQHSDTITRRNFILYAVKKDMKESLQNTKVDSLLFGQQLPDILKAAKAISKTGADLKAPPKPSTSKRNVPPKNWKSSNPPRKNLAAKAKEMTSSATRISAVPPTRSSRLSNSYRPSQSQRPARSQR